MISDDSFAGTVLVLIVVALGFGYLLPSYIRRKQYENVEKNTLFLQRAIRVLAQTSNSPEEVEAYISAKEAKRIKKIHRTKQAREKANRRKAMANELISLAKAQRDALRYQKKANKELNKLNKVKKSLKNVTYRDSSRGDIMNNKISSSNLETSKRKEKKNMKTYSLSNKTARALRLVVAFTFLISFVSAVISLVFLIWLPIFSFVVLTGAIAAISLFTLLILAPVRVADTEATNKYGSSIKIDVINNNVDKIAEESSVKTQNIIVSETIRQKIALSKEMRSQFYAEQEKHEAEQQKLAAQEAERIKIQQALERASNLKNIDKQRKEKTLQKNKDTELSKESSRNDDLYKNMGLMDEQESSLDISKILDTRRKSS